MKRKEQEQKNYPEAVCASRRTFIAGAGASVLAGARLDVFAESSSNHSDLDISGLLIGAGVAPDTHSTALMAILSDIHINLSSPTRWMETINTGLIEEINGMTPLLTHLAFSGDVATSHSRAQGVSRNMAHYAAAREEMRNFRNELSRFRSGLDIISVPGNHDTDNQELQSGGIPELWLEEIGTPPYQLRHIGGMPVFFLNSGHNGDLNPAQAAWFAAETALLDPDQEVLIIAHHPSFLRVAGETGLKRKVVRALHMHRAPVWLVGGHAHGFQERYYTHEGTPFIQMQTTSANPIQWGDGNQAGYLVLCIQNGRLRARIRRSLSRNWISALPPLESMQPDPLPWPFDAVDHPLHTHEEGDYDRSGFIVDFEAADLLTHFFYVKQVTWRIEPARYGGRLRDFIVIAGISPARIHNLRCGFAAHMDADQWRELEFPASEGNGFYRFAIPDEFLDHTELFIRVSTIIAAYSTSLSIAGWGLTGSHDSLTGYERWLARHRRKVVSAVDTMPEFLEPGYSRTNIERFAHNLDADDSQDGTQAAISGAPETGMVTRQVLEYAFPARKTSSRPGIHYIVEESEDLSVWRAVPMAMLDRISLNHKWDEIRCRKLPERAPHGFHRVRIEEDEAMGDGYRRWLEARDADDSDPFTNESAPVGDLERFAFNLSGLTSYDGPVSGDVPSGLPISRLRNIDLPCLSYARMCRESDPGVRYILEVRDEAGFWSALEPRSIHEEVLERDQDWEKVRIIFLMPSADPVDYRIRLELTRPLLEIEAGS